MVEYTKTLIDKQDRDSNFRNSGGVKPILRLQGGEREEPFNPLDVVLRPPPTDQFPFDPHGFSLVNILRYSLISDLFDPHQLLIHDELGPLSYPGREPGLVRLSMSRHI